jgi:hypothetical protein
MFDDGFVEKILIACRFPCGRVEDLFLNLRVCFQGLADFRGEFCLFRVVFEVFVLLEIFLDFAMVML